MKKFFKRSPELSDVYAFIFTIIFVIVLLQYPLATFEAILYDIKVKYNPFYYPTKSIVIITMDEESDDYLGDAYPYTHATLKRFVEKLIQAKPWSISFFNHFAISSNDSEDNKNKKDTQELLSIYEKNGGILSFVNDTEQIKRDDFIPSEWGQFKKLNGPIVGDNNVFSRDEVVRRTFLTVGSDESYHVWLANLFREKVKRASLNVQNIKGASYNEEYDSQMVNFLYSSSPDYLKSKITSLPMHRVLVGAFPKNFFEDKIVLIGPSYLSERSHFVLTPFNSEEFKAPKLNVHAQIINALIEGKTISLLPKWFSNIVAFTIALALSIVIASYRPKIGLIATLSTLVGYVIFSYLLFTLLGYWIYSAHIIVSIFVVYYIWIPFRAIGEYQRRFAIQEEAKLLKQVEKLKQNFLSLMSHDLKTPVAKIAGVVDNLIMQNRESSELKEKLTIIQQATGELNRFITSILDLTKIESSSFGLNLNTKDINTLIEQVKSDLDFQAKTKQIEIEIELSPLYPITIDTNLITRVISNLVENAIKYSFNGSRVTVKTYDDDKWVYVEIADNGPGISPDELQHVFDKFYRIKNDANHSIKGSGLGLYLVKYFVELHGGKIQAESRVAPNEGHGTKFVVSLLNQ